MYFTNKVTKELLKYIDIIVDGQFEIENKLVNLAFRGSTNQRKIDVQKSIAQGKLVRLKFGDEARYENKKPKIMFFEEYKKDKKQNILLEKTKSSSYNVISFENSQNDVHNNFTIDNTKEKISAKEIGNNIGNIGGNYG